MLNHRKKRACEIINSKGNLHAGAGRTGAQASGVYQRKRTQAQLQQSIILKAINEMILDKSGYMKMLQENIATVIRQ